MLRIEGNSMNNQENKETNQNNYTDPRTINAEVIGELRKDKIGKPILVVEMFIIFGIVLIGLPIINSLMNNQNSFLYKLIHPSEGININTPATPTEKDEFLNGAEEQQLASATIMKYENIVMKNFSLKGNNINCDIYSYNGVLNLDEENYFLEVYSSSSNNLIASVKLTGTYDHQSQSVSLTANKLSFNGNYSYVGKIVKKNLNDFPSFNVTSDESGIGSMVCKMNNRTLKYTFKNNYLIGINDSYRILLNEQKDSTAYLNLKKQYEDKANSLGTNAEVEEVADGFVFNANIDLEKYKVPNTVVDYDYYPLDTEAKVINFTLEGKGYDCE